jgi:tetratricopeptide (TPR) repeat protein
MGVPEILKKWAFHKQALVALSILSLFCLSVLTWRQTGYWKNNITLYNHTLRVIDHSISANPTPPLSNQPSRARTLTEVERSIWTKVRIALIYNNRGYSYSSLGNYRRAIQDYDKAIELNPRYAEAYNNRGIAYGSLGNYRMAIQDYDKAIELRPGYAEAYFNRGIENDNLRNYQEAIRDYDKAIGLNPEHAAAYYNRGINHANFGNPRQALRDMTEAARLGQPSAQDLLKKQGLNW